MTPCRVRRRRTKGWRMPASAVYVGRPTKWGNPFIIDGHEVFSQYGKNWWGFASEDAARAWAVASYEELLGWGIGRIIDYPSPGELQAFDQHRERILTSAAEIVGLDLACWCPLDQPCHADILLRFVNDT